MSVRIDQALVSRGLVRSRAQAKELLTDGSVLVNGSVEKKASTKIADSDEVTLSATVDHYVGRAAYKLIAAIKEFPEFASAIAGSSAIDVGASTGGFTQVLLENGIRHVVALDVGHGQLVSSLAERADVTNLEGLNIRDVISPTQLEGQPFDIVVSDLSFISLRLAMPHLRFLIANDGHMVLLIKPQFEVGRERLGRTGVVSSQEQRLEVIRAVTASAQNAGLRVHGLAWSPMVGSHGNHEYLLWLRPEQVDGGLEESRADAIAEELSQRT